MKIIKSQQVQNNSTAVGNGFTSERYLLQNDNMGFSFCITRIPAGGPYTWHYKHHKEACYCISGMATVKEENSYEHLITPGDMYVLCHHEKHSFTAIEDTVLVSVFNPSLTGMEVHDKENSYPENPMIFQKAKTAFNIAQNDIRTDAIDKIKKLFL